MTPEERRHHYHDRFHDDDCVACDPEGYVTHREMSERLAEMREPGPFTYDPARGQGEDPSEG